MKITRLDIYRISLPFDAGRMLTPSQQETGKGGDVYNAASPDLSRMESLLLRLHADDGRQGWGEAFGHLCNPATFAAMASSVGRFFLHRQTEDSIDGIATTMKRAHQAFHGFGSTGPVVYALSAFDTALWDLCAQAAGQPVRRLLNPNARDIIQVYASMPSYNNNPQEVAAQVRRAADAGYQKIKLHETGNVAILAARDALEPGIELMVDVNCPWTRDEGQRRVSDLRAARLSWLEEPLWPPDDMEGLAMLRGQGLSIAAGENAAGVQGMLQYLREKSVDIVQPSVAKIGGISGVAAVMHMAREHGVRVVPHCFYYGAGLSATAQIVAAMDDTVFLEVPFLNWHGALHAQLPVKPLMTLTRDPGLGFIPDMDVITANLVDSATLD
ncbi:mandelate racemase/muconate lactonizing enzyme family protein [Alcaligenaceae bacterium]|nr:mandelate racemase/muconate lactonizing enzyme family protein [Alcaligenaceae bacterium]